MRRTTALLCLWAMLFAQGAIAAHWGGMLARALDVPVAAAGHGHAAQAEGPAAHGHGEHDHGAPEQGAHGHAAHGLPSEPGSAGERVCQTHVQFDIQTLDLPRMPMLASVLVGSSIAPVHAAASLQACVLAAASAGGIRPPGAPPLSVLHCRFLI